MSARQQVLSCYKRLLKTRLEVFKGDEHAIRETRAAIRQAFEKNKNLAEPGDIAKSIKMAEDAEQILRNEVMQAQHLDDDTVRVNVRTDNVKRDRTFRFLDDD